MKKLLTLVLVMVLVLSSLTACSVDEIKGTVTDTFNTVKEKVTDTFDTVKKTVGGWFGIEFPDEEPDEPEVTYDVEAAKDYIYQLYVKGSYETPVDYKVVKQVFIKKVPHDVTWTTSSELVKVIVNETDVTIDVDEKATEDLVYTLTATVNAADGTSATVSFERMVPKYELLGYAQYLEKKTGEAVTVEGIVTLARSQSAGNKRDQLFIQDMNGVNGYYVYYTDKDYVKEIGLKVGMKVSVTGIKEIYGATHEIKEASVTILDETITTLTPNDITELFKTNTDPKAAALMDRLGSLVTIKGVVIGGQDLADSSKYLYFEMEGGCKTYVRVYTTDLGVGVMNAEQETAVFADHLAKRDYLANVTGVVDVYSDAIYISPVGPTPFEFLTKVERTPAQKIDIAISELEVPKSIEKAGEITLPIAGTTYPEVSFAWSTDSELIAIDGGKLTVTLPEETTTITLTLKANCAGAPEVVKTYEIKIYAPSADLYVPVVSDKVEAEKPFKLILNQATLGKTLYFAGDIADVDYRLATTDKADQATDVYLENVTAEGSTDVIGYRLYFYKGETKTYIRTYERTAGEATKGKGSIALVTEAPAEYYTYDETVKTLIVTSPDGVNKYCIGTYSTYDTISCSNASFVNADNVDKSQFPVHLATIEFVKDEVVEPDTPDTPDTPDEPGDEPADELKDIDLTVSTLGNPSNAYSAGTATISGFGFEYVEIGNYGNGIQMRTKSGKSSTIWNTTAFTKGIKKIELTYNAAKLSSLKDLSNAIKFTFGNEMGAAACTVNLSTVAGTATYTVTPDKDTYTYFKLLHTASNSFYFDSIKIYFELPPVPAADKVAAEKAALKFPFETVNFDRVITLPTVKQYTDVAITWEISENSVATLADGKVTVTTGDAAETVTLTATLNCGNEATDTKTFEVKINAKSPLNVTKVTAPVAGKAYKIYLRQFNADNVFFVNGGVTDGRFDTTTSLEDAIDVYVEVVEGGFKFYGGTNANKMYVNVDKAGKISLAATTDCVFKYDADKNCWYTTVVTSEEGAETVTTQDYYLGSYSNYTNVSASKSSYINASNTGVSQFPAELVTLVCNHLWDSDCDTTCGVCGETREVNASHTYDADCTDADCNLCGATRTAAAAHVYDADCTDTTCNNAGCQVTREAQTHVYDADCTDATCNNAGCQVTREAADAHVYDADCTDATCNNAGCQVTREAATAHAYDADCTDATCNNAGCQVTREAADAHVYDADCTDTTCNNEGCQVTREAAAAHVYDADCTDTTCNNEGCQVTREAQTHVYDADCTDATCNNEGCQVTREAADAHVYDADCTDATCNNEGCQVTREAADAHAYTYCTDTNCANEGCSVTREAQTHVYAEGCTDTTCENCAHTREAADHNFTGKCGNPCTECGVANPDAKTCVDSDSDNACDNCGVEMDANGDTPAVDEN